MKVSFLSSEHFLIEFENEEELLAEYQSNISAGGLFFQTTTQYPEFTAIQITLKLINGGQLIIPAMVVKAMGTALAVSIETKPELIWSTLTVKADEKKSAASVVSEPNIWERIRHLSRTEKLLLASKADRREIQVLLQDQDAQILLSLLKNPRISTEDVLRIARSSQLSAVAADSIANTKIWSSNSAIRAALVNNPRTPTPLALKILPTLPEPEIRQIAKATAVSQALKQAALRIVVNRK